MFVIRFELLDSLLIFAVIGLIMIVVIWLFLPRIWLLLIVFPCNSACSAFYLVGLVNLEI